MRRRASLDDVIRGKTSLRVLRTLALFPEKEFTGRELARMAGSAPSKVIGELERLKDLGLVTRKTHGRTHAWKANAENLVFRLMTPMFEGEHELARTFDSELRDGLDDDRISRAILFGSFARGSEAPSSDVDLLVLTDRAADIEGVREALDALSVRMSKRFGVRVSPILHAESELPRLRKTPLFASIATEGRAIRGEPL